MLSKFTVLALYAIYFSRSSREYAEKCFNMFGKSQAVFNEASKGAKVALAMMNPKHWNDRPASKELVRADIAKLECELRVAEWEYKSAQMAGSQLTMRTRKEKVEKLRNQLKSLRAL